jgi:GMP synthase PP-ATPase subunit
MNRKRIEKILHNCSKTIDVSVNRVGASNEIFKYIEDLEQQVEKQKEVINNFLDIVDKSKMLLNNPDLLDLYLKIKEVSE